MNSVLCAIQLLKLGSGHRDPVEAPSKIVMLTERWIKCIRLLNLGLGIRN